MSPVRTTSALLAQGYTANELARARRSGTIRRIRRGAYETGDGTTSAVEAHRALVIATMAQVSTDAVVSHQSAAVLHRLPLLDDPPARVQLTRDAIRSGKNRGFVHVHASPIDRSEVCTVDQLRVTSLARTVVDLARALPMAQAVASGDAALRVGLAAEELARSLGLAAGRPGIAQARRALAFLDRRSESVGESWSRVSFHERGLPAPEPQLEVRTEFGQLVGRVDFGWEEQGVLGEFDGRTKYKALLRPGQRAEDVVFAEKRREDALRELGWLVIRWVWSDLHHPELLAERIRRAFARAARR